MSLRILIDMNLSPEWVNELRLHGFDAVHWASVGDARADDGTLISWARANGYTLFTHDLDFGTLLAMTHAAGPSVLQIRGQNVLPGHMGAIVRSALTRYDSELRSGALVTIEQNRSRVRVLPL